MKPNWQTYLAHLVLIGLVAPMAVSVASGLTELVYGGLGSDSNMDPALVGLWALYGMAYGSIAAIPMAVASLLLFRLFVKHGITDLAPFAGTGLVAGAAVAVPGVIANDLAAEPHILIAAAVTIALGGGFGHICHRLWTRA